MKLLFKMLNVVTTQLFYVFKDDFFSLDDMNWNALEWDRAAEELTWERVGLHDITDLEQYHS